MEEKLCPRDCGNPARIDPMFGVMPCASCVNEDRHRRRITDAPQFVTLTMQSRVQEQRDRHEKDLLPPYDHNGIPNEDFRRAFPEKAKDLFKSYENVTGNTTELTK